MMNFFSRCPDTPTFRRKNMPLTGIFFSFPSSSSFSYRNAGRKTGASRDPGTGWVKRLQVRSQGGVGCKIRKSSNNVVYIKQLI